MIVIPRTQQGSADWKSAALLFPPLLNINPRAEVESPSCFFRFTIAHTPLIEDCSTALNMLVDDLRLHIGTDYRGRVL